MIRRTQFLVIFLAYSCICLTLSLSTNEVKLQLYSKEDGKPLTFTDKIFLKHRDLVIELELSSNHLFLDVHLGNHFEDDIGKNIGMDIKKNSNCNGIAPQYYNGKIRNKDDSAVNLMICGEIIGLIRDGNEIMNIVSGFQKDNIVVDSNNDFLSDFEDTSFLTGYKKNLIPPRVKRDTSKDNLIIKPYRANDTSRYIELALVVDYDVYENHTSQGLNETKIYQYWQDVVNKVNNLYEEQNMFVALVDIEIINIKEKKIAETKDTVTLDAFKNYTKGKKQDDFDVIILMTNVTEREDGNVIVLKTNSMCGKNSVGLPHGLISKILNNTIDYETSIAYLLGKFLGLHDNYKNHCVMYGYNYLMRTLSWNCDDNFNITKQLADSQYEKMLCLKELPSRLFNRTGPNCGNSFQEKEEMCDCGLSDTCPNEPCCDANTCRLKENATCASGGCCDNCTLRSTNYECRKTEHECDIAEFCDGQHSHCPKNIFKSGTERCITQTSYCKNFTCDGKKTYCSLNCSNNGICDSIGTCHCFGIFDNSEACLNTPEATTQTSTSSTITSTITTITTSTDSTRTEKTLIPASFFGNMSPWAIRILIAIPSIIFIVFCIFYVIKRFCWKRSQWNPRVAFANASTPNGGSSTMPKSPRTTFSPKLNRAFIGDSPDDLQYSQFPYRVYDLPLKKNPNKETKYATLDWPAGTSSAIPEHNDTVYSSMERNDSRHEVDAFGMEDFSNTVLFDDPALNPKLQPAKKSQSFDVLKPFF